MSKEIKLELIWTVCDIIFMQQKSKGPRTEPWGTPQSEGAFSEILGLILVVCEPTRDE